MSPTPEMLCRRLTALEISLTELREIAQREITRLKHQTGCANLRLAAIEEAQGKRAQMTRKAAN